MQTTDDLDDAMVGAKFLAAIAAAYRLGHTQMEVTLGEYVDRDRLNKEGQFVFDALTMTIPELIQAWDIDPLDRRAANTMGQMAEEIGLGVKFWQARQAARAEAEIKK